MMGRGPHLVTWLFITALTGFGLVGCGSTSITVSPTGQVAPDEVKPRPRASHVRILRRGDAATRSLTSSSWRTIASLHVTGDCFSDVLDAEKHLKDKACDLGATDVVIDSETYGLPYICTRVRARALVDLRSANPPHCAAGEPVGCRKLGEWYQDHGEAESASQAFREACEGGDAEGCVYVGRDHEAGRSGIPKDTARAVTYYQRGCESGVALGCRYLGSLYRGGRGVEVDKKRAATLFEKACEGGDSESCADIAAMYAASDGVRRDFRRAARYSQMACAAEVGDGCAVLGVLHQAGTGVAKDLSEARRLYTLGCELGSAVACGALATLDGR